MMYLWQFGPNSEDRAQTRHFNNLSCHDLEKLAKVAKTSSSIKVLSLMYQCQFGLAIVSEDNFLYYTLKIKPRSPKSNHF